MEGILAPGSRDTPYWWDAAPPVALAAGMPGAADVAVIGSGLTGLHAALPLLRAGRSVAIFDTEDPGFGASRRNAGFLGRVLKKSLDSLIASHGAEYALAIYRELAAAYQTTMDFIAAEGIDCHAVRCGRFVAATTSRAVMAPPAVTISNPAELRRIWSTSVRPSTTPPAASTRSSRPL